MEFWTSGANEDEFCDVDSIYNWCSINKTVLKNDIDVTWTTSTTSPATNERCLSLQSDASSFSLRHSDCANAKRSVICEVGYASM
jgi:hypothetical protein